MKKQDLLSSLVVFVIAMPLSLGIALASGASPAAGLITAIIGGVVAGFFAGAPLTVTGPAAGMTALVFQLIQTHGLRGLAIITVIAGALQISFGLFRAGGLFKLIPRATLEGVLTAIGAIIVIGQVHVLFGGSIPRSPFAGLTTLPPFFWPIALCGVIALGVQLVFKKSRIPAALPAIVGVTLLSLMWDMPRVTLEPLMPLVRDSFGHFFAFSESAWVLLAPALGVAVVASAESLLTARAVDTLKGTTANLNKELFAQGVANMISGIAGGLPMTAVMVRSAANVNNGAQTRWSTIFHGLWIAVFVGLLPFLIMKVPLTALASVLILTGIKLLNLKHLAHELRTDRKSAFLWITTTVIILATDLLTGLIASLVLALVMHFAFARKAIAPAMDSQEAA